MPYLEKGDLETHIYTEIIDTITRDADSVINEAIAVGVAEAKSYLMRFDLKALFGFTEGDNETPPTVEDANLKSKVKDLVGWHLIRLANPNINMEVFRTAYEDAIKFFQDVKKSQLAPDGWPYKPDDAATLFNEGAMVFGNSSNLKRNNHW